jgi:AraC-like DNA-binding protein
VGLPRYAARHNAEYVVAGIRTGLRMISGHKATPTKIAFAHTRNSDIPEFERFFGCPVEFGATNTAFQISADALHLPLITPETMLLRVLRPYCDAAAKERKVKPGTLRSAVEAEVEKLLPHGKAKAENIAQVLAVSRPTLARRLAYEGTTYGEVVDQLRKSLAIQYLKDPRMSLGQIVWLLGYEGSTSFNHAFKRWTGRSPPADPVRVRNSVTSEYLICLEDGKKLKSLRRHLRALGLTPKQYREKWSLPSWYPMVAANYSNNKSTMAKMAGFGRKRKANVDQESLFQGTGGITKPRVYFLR